MNKRNSLIRYSLSPESSRWWWSSATAGAAATLAVVTIVGFSSAGNAIPVDTDRYSTPAEVTVRVPAPTDAGASSRSQDDIPLGFRQCFMWQPHWNEALDGPQPWCPIDPPAPDGDRPDGRTGGEDSADPGAAAAGNLPPFSLHRAELAKWVPIP
jgi:hypothetical protein